MKKALIIILIVIVAGIAGFFILRSWTKSHSPEEHLTYSENGLDIEITYSRPYKKGRDIFGGLVPYGEVWRTGANEATTIEVDDDVMLAGKALKSGSYSLWTIPEKEQWTIILNDKTGQWGTQYDSTKNILEVKVPAKKSSELVEQFKIELNGSGSGVDLILKWENTVVAVPIQKQ